MNGADGEVKAFVDILLYYKHDGEWSKGIPGTGGSSFVSNEKGGKYNNDECFKCALSDAIGTACKALGMSADIYFQKDRTKYTSLENDKPETKQEAPKPKSAVQEYKCECCGKPIPIYKDSNGKTISPKRWAEGTLNKFKHVLCADCTETFNA